MWAATVVVEQTVYTIDSCTLAASPQNENDGKCIFGGSENDSDGSQNLEPRAAHARPVGAPARGGRQQRPGAVGLQRGHGAVGGDDLRTARTGGPSAAKTRGGQPAYEQAGKRWGGRTLNPSALHVAMACGVPERKPSLFYSRRGYSPLLSSHASVQCALVVIQAWVVHTSRTRLG